MFDAQLEIASYTYSFDQTVHLIQSKLCAGTCAGGKECVRGGEIMRELLDMHIGYGECSADRRLDHILSFPPLTHFAFLHFTVINDMYTTHHHTRNTHSCTLCIHKASTCGVNSFLSSGIHTEQPACVCDYSTQNSACGNGYELQSSSTGCACDKSEQFCNQTSPWQTLFVGGRELTQVCPIFSKVV